MKFVVIDTETNWGDEVMSVGAVISDENYQVVDSRYYIIEPECTKGAMYEDVLHLPGTPEEKYGSRYDALMDMHQWLRANGVDSIYAYNAIFDKGHMPEFGNYQWFDIMKIAAFRQYNKAIPNYIECYSNGRMKRGYGVQSIYRMLSENPRYSEKHNGWFDAMDELKIMEMLALPIETYGKAKL